MGGKLKMIDLENLELDLENPRLPASFKTQEADEKRIINWMLEDASIIELMLAIGQNDFFIGESLLVIKNSNDSEKYIVIEGNRRLTSLKLLSNPSLAEVHTRKIEKILQETSFRPKSIPCIVFEERVKIMKYLGFRHVTGIKSWGMLEKARYLYSLKQELKIKGFDLQCRELAKTIGSRSDYIRRVLTGYLVYLKIQDSAFYRIPQLDDTSFHFNYIADALTRENIREFLGVDFDIENPIEKLNEVHLERLTNWFFRKNQFNKSQVLGDSKHLTALNELLASPKALKYFEDSGNFWEAHKYVNLSPDTFHHSIKEASRNLTTAWTYINEIEKHNEQDKDILKEIQNYSKNMLAVVTSKENNEE